MMRASFVVLVLALAVLLAGGEASCTPAQRAELRPLVEPTERATCIMLRAFVSSGEVDSVCATADDLAPFVAELLAAHDAEAAPVSAPTIAFSVPAPSRKIARRRCALWVPVNRTLGITDGGADGG